MMKMKKRTFTLLILCVVVLLSGRTSPAAGLEADMLILNGRILTADSPGPNQFSIAQTAAVYDGKFIAVGSNEEALEYAGPSTPKIDLGGRTVIPGLVETHNHIYGYGSHFFRKECRRLGEPTQP